MRDIVAANSAHRGAGKKKIESLLLDESCNLGFIKDTDASLRGAFDRSPGDVAG